MKTINVGLKDVLWTYSSVFFQKIGNGLILFPFILRRFSQESVGILTVFLAIIGFTTLLDFGFSTSFIRSVSYVFSGASTLQKNGIFSLKRGKEVDYSLLKGLIETMNKFYARLSWFLLIILSTLGTYYIHFILKNYSGNSKEIYVSWVFFSLITSYSFSTLYLDVLILGKGLVMRSNQIAFFSQIIYLVIAFVLIFFQFDLLAVICARAVSILFSKYFFYKTVYTKKFKQKLKEVVSPLEKKIFKTIFPNAIKIGLTHVGGFFVNQFITLMAPFYLSFEKMASYGLTQQIIGVITSLANAYYFVYQQENLRCRMQEDISSIKRIYLRGVFLLFLIFLFFGLGLLCLGSWVLDCIGSQTHLLSKELIVVALLIAGLEANHSNSAGILLTKNEVPFFRASLFSGAATVVLLFLFFQYTDLGVWAVILAPGIAQAVYQNWKWTLEVFRDLKIKRQDIFHLFSRNKNCCRPSNKD